MPRVIIPSLMRSLTKGRESIYIDGLTVAELIDSLDVIYPGVGTNLIVDGKLKRGVAVAVDGVVAYRGAAARVNSRSTVRFLPAVEGG